MVYTRIKSYINLVYRCLYAIMPTIVELFLLSSHLLKATISIYHCVTWISFYPDISTILRPEMRLYRVKWKKSEEKVLSNFVTRGS